MRPFRVLDLGRADYASVYRRQLEIAEAVGSGDQPDTLVLVEHEPVLTLGASFHEENLLFPRAAYEDRGIAVERTDRGGDVTYHGPGQLVAYPIFDVASRGKDLHRWMREMEEAVLKTLATFGLDGRRFPPHTGVWIENRKICAQGVKMRRWVSIHGIALNCDNDLGPFRLIVPCGIKDYPVTSVSVELGRRVTVEDAKPALIDGFSGVFGPVLASNHADRE